MALLIALIISVVLHLGAAGLAVSLIKRTKYNASWILISIGFSIMAFRRIYDLVALFNNDKHVLSEPLISTWLSIIVSLLFFIGTFFIKKIFNLQERIESLRKGNEARIFSAIIRTEERERQTFAKELHDGLGPILSSIKMAISAISIIIKTETDKVIVKKTNFAIDEAILTVKEISNKLSPHILTNFGIEKALKNFTDTLVINKKLVIKISSDLAGSRYEFTAETVVYRVLCELIANTLNHANARHITISLKSTVDELNIDYTDDGVGCTLEEVYTKGMGLSNIQSRISSLHGSCLLESSPGEGFRAVIQIPL